MFELTSIFEISISFITALLGLSYPLFIDKISGIDKIYKNLKISKIFEDEILYKIFNVLIIVCIVELFIFPFVINAENSQTLGIIFLIIQTVCVFALTMDMTQLYFLIMVYNAPEKLSRRIILLPNSPKRLEELEIMIECTAANPMYRDVYSKCMEEFTNEIMAYQEKQL